MESAQKVQIGKARDRSAPERDRSLQHGHKYMLNNAMIYASSVELARGIKLARNHNRTIESVGASTGALHRPFIHILFSAAGMTGPLSLLRWMLRGGDIAVRGTRALIGLGYALPAVVKQYQTRGNGAFHPSFSSRDTRQTPWCRSSCGGSWRPCRTVCMSNCWRRSQRHRQGRVHGRRGSHCSVLVVDRRDGTAA